MRKILTLLMLLPLLQIPLCGQDAAVQDGLDNVLGNYNRVRFVGTYHFHNPYNTPADNGDKYLYVTTIGGDTRCWLYAPSDEFDSAREGYRAGYFVAEGKGITIEADTMRFSVTVGGRDCFVSPVSFRFRSTEECVNENVQQWKQVQLPEQRLDYVLILDNSGESCRLINTRHPAKVTENFFRERVRQPQRRR